jgi:hypothetical protein
VSDDSTTGLKVLALVIGFWLLMRSVNRDATGRTLIDYLLGNAQSQSPFLSAPVVTNTQDAGTPGLATSGPEHGAGTPSGSGAPAAGGSAPRLGEGVALKGAPAATWADRILAAIGAPASSANVSSLEDWFDHEGGGGANNPLNTTLKTTGSAGSINSVGVQSYISPAAGIAATAQTLSGGYPAIVAALRGGGGLLNGGPSVSSELSTWSGGGYSSL